MRNERSNSPTSIQSKLAVKLKTEARLDRPVFSDALHERIMRSVAAPNTSTPHTPATIELNAASRRSVARWVAIAAGLLIAALGVMQLGGSGDNRLQRNPPAPASSGVATAQPVGDQVTLDDLDHGAAAAVQLVVDQLPIEVPTVDWGAALVD
jgi:hypothetical protein